MLPSYLHFRNYEKLNERIKIANAMLSECRVCPNECRINRNENKQGICFSGKLPIVSTYTAHFGEEPVISGLFGAGNIFFGNCNLKCVYCQNYQISQNPETEKSNEVSNEKLASIMIELQNRGCHNIGLVSPSHFVPQIIFSINEAIKKGLNLPLVYNSNGYDSVKSLKLLEDIIDIYLPDFKYGCDESAEEYSSVNRYFESASDALLEMYRQIGDDFNVESGILKRGIIVRHLVLPNNLSETEKVFKFIAENVSKNIHISLMSQYHPVFKSEEKILISRKLSEREYERAVELLDKYGLKNGWIQELKSHNYYLPDFNEDRFNPFSNCQ